MQSSSDFKSPTSSVNDVWNESESEEGSPSPNGNDEGMDSLIEILNELYDIVHHLNMEGLTNFEINLPQIAVCGSQSSGKTSVLESISGEEFLPRGIDIQTRCPIILQLIHTTGSTKWVEFLHAKGKKFTDMNDVKKEIQEINKRIIDSKLVVSEEPITLKLFSPNVPKNLTLVDLPGLVENPTDDQPADVVEKIKDLNQKYISQSNCIILAISQATVDIADSKSIRLSKIVDPNGERTLGVLTKLDLMDEGTNANEVLLGRKIKLPLGIIGVVNRGYRDVEEGKCLQDQLIKERNFLEANYPMIARTNGTPYLIKRITGLLLHTIKRTLPDIQTAIKQLIEKQQQVLDYLGEPEIIENDKKDVLLQLLISFVETYCAQIDGRRRNLDNERLNASARIKIIFDLELKGKFDTLGAGETLTDTEIDTVVYNGHGIHSRDIIEDDAAQEFTRREIKKLAPCINKCVDEVWKEMQHAIDTSCDPIITDRYTQLYQKIKDVASELIKGKYKDCQKQLEEYLNAEASYARTIDGEFRDKSNIAGNTGNGSSMFNGQQGARSTSEGFVPHREKVRESVSKYFDLAKRQIMEHVARAIVYKLVYGTSDQMMKFMLNRLNSPENAETLLVDAKAEERRGERRRGEQMLAGFEDAHNCIDTIFAKIVNIA